jgi:hypothetical protein
LMRHQQPDQPQGQHAARDHGATAR